MATGRAAGWIGMIASAIVGGAAQADLPESVRGVGHDLSRVGQGRLTWLGFGIYEASLWTRDGRFEGFEEGEPVALALWYERKFSRQQLIDITTGEWERLDLAPAATRSAWARQLDAMWKDVARGDNLTAVVLPGGETQFFDRQGVLGRVDDPAFGPAFLRIWLDSRTAIQDLRAQLLGEPAPR
ncbi:MAG: chalcone isomerase family protein [Gammaproteobacteria bacterium]|nr:chalcone isomerase family protein [Gammaproteobacteria bacterium]